MNVPVNSVDYLHAFLGGVIVSFTPCVYPLIPITAGYIGANASGSRLKGLVLSLIYVTGIAVIYSILGILASFTGTFFGKISTHPATYFLAGTVIILFGLSMLDLFIIPHNRLVKPLAIKKQNYFSVFVLGLSSGLIISPCLTPVLGSILAYLATKRNVVYATTLLFSFAYGMGLILILAGTFSAILVNLPKSGKWMVHVKKVCAFVLIGMGVYFIFVGIGRL